MCFCRIVHSVCRSTLNPLISDQNPRISRPSLILLNWQSTWSLNSSDWHGSRCSLWWKEEKLEWRKMLYGSMEGIGDGLDDGWHYHAWGSIHQDVCPFLASLLMDHQWKIERKFPNYFFHFFHFSLFVSGYRWWGEQEKHLKKGKCSACLEVVLFQQTATLSAIYFSRGCAC